MRRAPILALGALALAAWCAPMLALRLWLTLQGGAVGVDATTSGLRPAWPFGVSARKISFTRAGGSLPIQDLELLLGPGGWNGEAHLGAGHLRLHAPATGGAVVAYVRDLPLDRLELSAPELHLSGLATGVVRWRGEVFEISGQAHQGALSAGPGSLGIPFDGLDVLARVSPSGRIELGQLRLWGASVVLAAAGSLDPQAGADLQLRIDRIEEPLRSALELSGLRVQEVPTRLAIRGPLAAPSILRIDAR